MNLKPCFPNAIPNAIPSSTPGSCTTYVALLLENLFSLLFDRKCWSSKSGFEGELRQANRFLR